MRNMIYRMCWNTRGWRMPTHASRDSDYPSHMGFGHEEWNFQLEDAVKGDVYGYLYYHPSARVIRDADGLFRIGFWSIHPDTRQRLLVGFYNRAMPATAEDYALVERTFERKGVYERRAEELASVVPAISFEEALREVRNSVNKRLLNFKCHVDAIEVLPEPIPLHTVVGKRRIGQNFTTPTFVPALDVAEAGTVRRGKSDAASAKLAEDAYYRESPQNLKRIIRRHNALSSRFASWLKKSGFRDVAHERNFVDITFRGKSDHYRAELKTCYGVGTTRAIREALGQLLEYNLYPGRERADNWTIIIDERPSRHDIEYVLALKHRLKVPLSLGWRERDGFVFPQGLEL